MSIREILDPNSIDETWKSLEVYNIHSANGIQTDGNITIENSNPNLYIINNVTGSVNRATINLVEAPGIAAAKIQEFNGGTLVLQTFQTGGHISLRPSDSVVDIIGSQYPAGPYLLGLSASNTVVRGTTGGTFTPILNFGVTGLVAYNYNVGLYNKIDNVVNFSINISPSSIPGGTTGAASITGLPFVSNSAVNQNIAGLQSSLVGTTLAGGKINQSDNRIFLVAPSDVSISQANVTSGSVIWLNGFYFSA